MTITHYVRVDDDRNPIRLLRGLAGSVERWEDGRWVKTGLFQPQLDGLGGASDYRQLRDEDVAKWKRRLG